MFHLQALVYAHQFSRRDALSEDDVWKFSKARQNWLVRHIWYEDAVPEQYVPLVLHYLESVKGGSREVCTFSACDRNPVIRFSSASFHPIFG